MFLKLNHQKLEIYKISRALVVECYKLTKAFPIGERYSMVSQIRRAALSVHLNIAEGSSRRSMKERKRFYEIARGSVVEVDAAFDIANDLGILQHLELKRLEETIVQSFAMLSSLIRVSKGQKSVLD